MNNQRSIKVEVILKNETVWLTQKAIAALFDVNVLANSKHLINVYESGERNREATISILETVQIEVRNTASINVWKVKDSFRPSKQKKKRFQNMTNSTKHKRLNPILIKR